jgi:thiamine biosynthesis lipoprotein
MCGEVPEEGDSISVKRRTFLINSGALFVTYALAKTGIYMTDFPATVEETRLVMGSASRITAIGEDKSRQRVAIGAAFNEMKRLEALMTLFNEESEVSHLNRNGRAIMSPECIDILQRSHYLSRTTNGAFDVTLGKYKDLSIETNVASFKRTGMTVDLGAIGIGYAVDRAVDVLKSKGVKRAIVDGGGEVKSLGSKTDMMSWRVGIKDPFDKQSFIEVINLDDLSISTSGNYEKMHIVDPKTGEYPNDLVCTTVIAKQATTADAISTAAFVLGKQKGLELIESISQVEGLLVTSAEEVIQSSGFDRYVVSGL